MAPLRREEVDRLRHACRGASEAARALRAVRAGLGAGPGYRECRKADALAIPDELDERVFLAARPLDPVLMSRLGERMREAREAVGYAAAAIREREWDDAATDLDRAARALDDVERTLHREIPAPLGWFRPTMR